MFGIYLKRNNQHVEVTQTLNSYQMALLNLKCVQVVQDSTLCYCNTLYTIQLAKVVIQYSNINLSQHVILNYNNKCLK